MIARLYLKKEKLMKKWLKKANISQNTIPDWLYRLPPGQYTIMQICKLTEQSYSNVSRRMQILSVPSIQMNIEEYRKKFDPDLKIHGRNYVMLYNWKGYEPYLEKIIARRLKNTTRG